MIGLKDFDKSYNYLLGLGMTTVDDLLKWAGQWPKLMQVFDDIHKAFIMFEDRLEMVPRQFIQSWSGRVIIVSDCTLEFFFGEQCPKGW